MLSLYVHFPFCLKKCSYCSFNSYELNHNVDYYEWLKKYCQALAFFEPQTAKEPLASIYFGGGTPSLMPDFMIAEIINYADKIFGFKDNIEISLEANPNTINQNMVNNLKNAGINRISIGVQSFNDEELQFLGRIHNVKQALNAVNTCQKTFNNVSIDLIYGLPKQDLTTWQRNVEQAVSLNCQHYSLYQLSIEPNSKFYLNNVEVKDEETSANMFEMNQSLMNDAGFLQYEISNYALTGKECLHNFLCWQGYDYIGIGAGACGRLKNNAIIQNPNPDIWFNNPKNCEIDLLDNKTRGLELLILGLRTFKGIDSETFFKNCNQELLSVINKTVLDRFIDDNLLKFDNNCLTTTPKGLLVLDYILKKLVI